MKKSLKLVATLLAFTTLFSTNVAAQWVKSTASPGDSALRSPASADLGSDASLSLAPPRTAYAKAEAGPSQRNSRNKSSLVQLGTVSKHADGNVQKKTASKRVKAYLEATSQSNTPIARGGKFISSQKTIFGADDRVNIKQTTRYPFSAIGYISMSFPDGNSSCSGTLIGRRTVLTAAHCLFDLETGRWADSVVFFPGRNGRSTPLGSFKFQELFIPTAYFEASANYYSREHQENDIAVIELSEPAGDYYGYLAYGYRDELPEFVANIVGYPGDKPATMWRASCGVNPNDGAPGFFRMWCDTWPGSSGSAMYDYEPDTDGRLIVGVNIAESPDYNLGLRITRLWFEWLQSLE